MPHTWSPDFAHRSPMFEPLRAVADTLNLPCWPGCVDLNRLIDLQNKPMLTAGGKRLRFVEQAVRQHRFEDKFEPRVFLRGEVQFRSRNWHDLFNALVWLTFPASKAALNGRHYRELARNHGAGASGACNRGPVQDALTLFDEGGLIVAASNPVLTALLTACEWRELFWQRRAEVALGMRFYLFGHALYEKALAPFSGVTGRGVVIEVEDTFFDRPIGEQISALDVRLATRLDDARRFGATRELAPVPILGIPGWCEDNTRARYYDDTRYFRPALR